jgi:hypothetical protein
MNALISLFQKNGAVLPDRPPVAGAAPTDWVEKSIVGWLVLNNFYCIGATLAGRSADYFFILFRDDVEFDGRLQLIFVIFKDFGAEVVAISVSHTLAVDFYFHTVSSLSNGM